MTNFFRVDEPSQDSLYSRESQSNYDGNKGGQNTRSSDNVSNPSAKLNNSGRPPSQVGSLQQAMTDTLIEKVIAMALPPTTENAKDTLATRMAYSKTRPSLSVPITSKNFIMMNSRLSIPFILINEIIKIFDWENIPYTLSILLMYTFLVLKPIITITTAPLFYILFGIMVPQYIYIHKPNDCPLLDRNLNPAQGAPLRNPCLPEPTPQFSQEFILNVTDLQNHMLLYVMLYDFICSNLEKFAYFTNEQISCVVFVTLLAFALLNVTLIETICGLLPIKLLFLIAGWGFMAVMHPALRHSVLAKMQSSWLEEKLNDYNTRFQHAIKENLRFVEAREQKVVAIFEIQKYKEKYKEWRSIGFSNDDYSLFSGIRINEIDISKHCVKILDEVEPPIDWEWSEGSNWILDLKPKEWVAERFIQYVDIDTETKWVYDVDFNGCRGQYRRRMWTNLCSRKCEKRRDSAASIVTKGADGKYEHGTPVLTEEIVNPMRKEKLSTSHLHGVTLRSMSGSNPDSSRHSVQKSQDDDESEPSSIIQEIASTVDIAL